MFPDYVLYPSNDADVILVASAGPALPSPVNTLFGWPLMRAELDCLDIRTPADLAIFRIANRRATVRCSRRDVRTLTTIRCSSSALLALASWG